MASKASKINEVKEIDTSEVAALVKESMAFNRVNAKLEWLKEREQTLTTEKDETRKKLIKVMQTLSHHPWESLKGPIKAALIGAGCKNVDGALGVYKTSFKERVLPVGENADRFRKKMEFWIGWNGQKVRNPEFKKIEPKAVANSTTPAPTTTAPTTASTAPTTASTAPTIDAVSASWMKAVNTPPKPTTAPTAPTATAPTKAATASTASTTPTAPTRVNVNANDSLTTLEHWQTIHQQWMNNRLHMYYVQELSGILGIGPDKLQMALNEAGKALVSRASKK